MENCKRKIKHSLIVVGLLVTATSLTGCFKMGALFGSGGSNGSDSAASTSSTTGTAAAVIEASQILPTMAAVTGIKPSTTTKNAFSANVGNFSIAGSSTDVNPPMMFAYATVAAEMCNDLVKAEMAKTASTRRFYGCIDFTQGPSQFSGSCLMTTASIMSRSFYGSDLSAGEQSAIQTGVSALVSGAASGTSATTQTQQVALGLCTALLASMNSVSH